MDTLVLILLALGILFLIITFLHAKLHCSVGFPGYADEWDSPKAKHINCVFALITAVSMTSCLIIVLV